jgi:hypothetical protein
MAARILVERWQRLAGIGPLREGFAIYPDEQGVDPDEKSAPTGNVKRIKVSDCIGNEPNKDFNYFLKDKKEYVERMIETVTSDGEEGLPPIQAFKPPGEDRYWIIDGNHRLGAYKIAAIPTIRAHILSPDEVSLYPKGTTYPAKEPPVPFSKAKEDPDEFPLDAYLTRKELRVPADHPWVKGLRQRVRAARRDERD